jgi:hypothetical protein
VTDLDQKYTEILSELLGTIDKLPEGAPAREELEAIESNNRADYEEYDRLVDLGERKEWLQIQIDYLTDALNEYAPGWDGSDGMQGE